jgi:hypothetical protein
MKEIEQLRRENAKLWLAVILAFTVGTFTWALLMTPPAHGQKLEDWTSPKTFRTVPVSPTPKRAPSLVLPPPEYDHHYEGDLTIKLVDSVEHLAIVCKWPEVRPNSLGCATVRSDHCIIYLVQDDVARERGWNNGIILRHELGHCNGWPADHPGARGFPASLIIPRNERGR